MIRKHVVLASMVVAVGVTMCVADPCGMVPPVYTGKGYPITRIGLQQTYVFYKDGIETFVIRPGFQGKVDEFGMLIPFPNPPALRKVSDDVFPHLAAAVDPPEVVIDLSPIEMQAMNGAAPSGGGFGGGGLRFKKREVKVLNREAVGMYEVAVLAAGSADALKRWMDKHGFRYPDGMDTVTEEYVEAGWCFVAVKTKVGQKAGVDPKPAQRQVESQLPSGSNFDGNVQAMGFRFKTDELVVPMRLSAFNDGELRNVVYLLTDGPQKIRSIPEEYVVRQINGKQLFANLTQPLPLRIINGLEKDLQKWHLENLDQRRDPIPHNGVAKDIFASDLLAVSSGQMSLPHEEKEKELLRIGEKFGLRGPEVDANNSQALAKLRQQAVDRGLEAIKEMTLTVVDGDFPREVLANQNLTFAQYEMPSRRNNARSYDAKINAPGAEKSGILKTGYIDVDTLWNEIQREQRVSRKFAGNISRQHSMSFAVAGLFMLCGIAAVVRYAAGNKRPTSQF